MIFTPRPVYPWWRCRGTHWVWGWVDSRADLDAVLLDCWAYSAVSVRYAGFTWNLVLKVNNKICLRNLSLILTTIKVRRLDGADHLVWMSDDRTIKTVLLGKPDGRRKKAGIREFRWLDCIGNELTLMSAEGWTEKVEDGSVWAIFLKETLVNYTDRMPVKKNLMFIGPCIIAIVDERKTNLMSLAILFHLLCAQHVSDINISIIRSLRLCWWITTCCASACKTNTT